MLSILPLVASIFIALAVFLIASVMLGYPKSEQAKQALPPLERERRESMRKAKGFFQQYEQSIDDAKPVIDMFLDATQNRKLMRAFTFSTMYRDFQPAEFIGVKLIEGILAGLIVGAIIGAFMGLGAGVFAGFMVVFLLVFMGVSEVQNQSDRNRRAFLLRLPNAVDLLALMLEAGATFSEALSTLVRENRGHALGEQFEQVESDTALGRPRAEALRGLRDRINDPVVDELVMAINEGEEFGTPLAKILSNQAERMRLMKSQWIEKAAAEAQVQMAFPNLLIMVACSLVVLGPFVLQAVLQFLSE